jgi:hypothetical protein
MEAKGFLLRKNLSAGRSSSLILGRSFVGILEVDGEERTTEYMKI